MQILFASSNKNKQREAKEIFKNSGIELVFADLLPILENFDVEETGTTFFENSMIKAKAYAEKTGIVSLADDSGIEVDAMNGQPSVHSNRWFGNNATERNQEILRILAEKNATSKIERSCRYVCAACLYYPKTEEYITFSDTMEGSISFEEKGDMGFDYDRIFIPTGYEQTLAELGTEIKNTLSHRAKAFKKIASYLIKNKTKV